MRKDLQVMQASTKLFYEQRVSPGSSTGVKDQFFFSFCWRDKMVPDGSKG